MELIDLRTGSSTHELRGHSSSILTCAWSPIEEHLLATGGIDNKILLWDVRSGHSCLRILDQHNSNNKSATAHCGYVNGLRFAENGLLLLSFGTDNRLRLWETFNGNNQMINYGKVKNDVKKHVEFATSCNSKPSLAFVPSEGNIYVLELFTGRLINVLHGHFNSVNCCFYREMYQELYSGGNDRNVLMWTADDAQREAFAENVKDESRMSKRNPLIRTVDNWSSDENE